MSADDQVDAYLKWCDGSADLDNADEYIAAHPESTDAVRTFMTEGE